jgi:hypothetical protein
MKVFLDDHKHKKTRFLLKDISDYFYKHFESQKDRKVTFLIYIIIAGAAAQI